MTPPSPPLLLARSRLAPGCGLVAPLAHVPAWEMGSPERVA
jgi:hypothetical protein